MNLAAFIAWEPHDASVRRWQLIDGEPFAMAPAVENHGALQAEISRQLGNHLRHIGSRCRVITEPGIQPRVRSDRNYRIPDLAVTYTPASARLMMTDPVLIVEILSPSNAVKTWSNVWAYTTIPSVREIVVIHGGKIEAEVLRRNADGSWPEQPILLNADDSLGLSSIGFMATLKDLYDTTSIAQPV